MTILLIILFQKMEKIIDYRNFILFFSIMNRLFVCFYKYKYNLKRRFIDIINYITYLTNKKG